MHFLFVETEDFSTAVCLVVLYIHTYKDKRIYMAPIKATGL